MKHPNLRILFFSVLLFALCLSHLSCESQSPKNTNTRAKEIATPEISGFDRELKAMHTADFDFIFAFKRKDGEAFTSEDKKFLKNKTYKANRHTMPKDEKAIFVGTNYKISDENLAALKKRFDFEDFSKTKEQLETEKQDRNSNSDEPEGNKTKQ